MVVATARHMLKAKDLLRWFWDEAVSIVVYVLNMCPTKSVDSMTSFVAWCGRKLAVHHLRTFRCIVYIRNMMSRLKKLKDCAHKMIFVCYESSSKVYRLYNPVTKHAHMMRDVVRGVGGAPHGCQIT
jgi:hypothetical protein